MAISCGCSQQPGGLKKRVLGARSPKSRYLQGWSLPEALRGRLFHVLSWLLVLHSLAHGPITPVSAPSSSAPLPFVSPSVLPSGKDTSHWVEGPREASVTSP